MIGTLEPTNPLVQIDAELQRQLETKRDLVADTAALSLAEEDGKLYMNADVTRTENGQATTEVERFGVNRWAHVQIASHLGIPWKLYDRLAWGAKTERKEKPAQPDLLAHLANGLLVREPSKRMLRTIDGNVRAFLSNGYRRRDNFDLLGDGVLPVLKRFPGRVDFKACSLTETRMYVKIVLPDMEKPVTPKVGDVIRGGAIIQNSEVGAGQLGVWPYTDRLSCTNGAVHTEYGQGQRHVGRRIEMEDGEAWDLYSDATLKLDDEAFFAKVRDTLTGVLNEQVFDRIVADMQELAGIEVRNAPQAVEILSERHGFSDGEQKSLLDNLMIEGDRTAWGLVNAVTRTARDHENADRQVELEKLGGQLVAERKWALELAA